MKIRWKIAQFFESIWWQRYLKNKPFEEYVAWKKSYWSDFLKTHKIELKPNDKVLDAGCGPAGIFLIFDNKETLAVDPLFDTYFSKFPEFYKTEGRQISFEKAYLESFTKPHYFDKIFCLNVINHVADIGKSIRNLSKSLAANGEFYLSVDAHNYWFLKWIFKLFPGDILHPHQMDLQEYISLLENHSLKITSTQLVKSGTIFSYYLIKSELE